MCRLPIAYLYGQPIGRFLHTAVRGPDKVLICGSSVDLHTGFLLAPTYPSTRICSVRNPDVKNWRIPAWHKECQQWSIMNEVFFSKKSKYLTRHSKSFNMRQRTPSRLGKPWCRWPCA